jgi:hypothetical protein
MDNLAKASYSAGENDAIDTLRDEARASIPRERLIDAAREYRQIDRAAKGSYGPPEYALRILIAHLPNHDSWFVTEAIRLATEAKLPETTPITDDHVVVCQNFSQEFNELGKSLYIMVDGNTDYTERDKMISYAMHHIDDGHLMFEILYDRGVKTLDGILDLLPLLKESKHSALTEGIL